GVRVDDIHPLARQQLRERAGERSPGEKRERDDREPGVPREPRQQDVVAAAHQDAVSAPVQVLTQIEDRLRRAGRAALVGELKNRERPACHGPKLVILRRRCTSSSPLISSCRRRVTAVRSAWSWHWSAGWRRSGIGSPCSRCPAHACPKRRSWKCPPASSATRRTSRPTCRATRTFCTRTSP